MMPGMKAKKTLITETIRIDRLIRFETSFCSVFPKIFKSINTAAAARFRLQKTYLVYVIMSGYRNSRTRQM